MTNKRHVPIILALGLFLASPSYADEDDTMIVLEDGDTPEDIVQLIELPGAAADTAKDAALFGHETANQAKELGREFGQSVADDAKLGTQGADIRAEVRDNARRDARGDNGPGSGPGGRPE